MLKLSNDYSWFPYDEESDACRRTDLKVPRAIDVGRYCPNQDI